MKKAKILSCLCSLATLSAVSSFVIASCSNKVDKKLIVEIETSEIELNVCTNLYVSAHYEDYTVATIKDIKSESSDSSIVKIIGSFASTRTIDVMGLSVGSATLSVEVVDNYDNQVQTDFVISVNSSVDEKLVISATNVPASVDTGKSATFNVTATYDGSPTNISSCNVESSNEDVLSGTYSNGIVTIKGKSGGNATLTLKVTDVNKHYNKTTTESITVTLSPNTIICNGGMTYELADNLDPNLFVSYAEGAGTLTKEIPKKDGGNIVFSDSDEWGDIEEIKLGNRDPTNTDISDYFLYFCRELQTLDLTGLVNVKTINKSFLSLCNSLINIDMGSIPASAFGTDDGTSFACYATSNEAYKQGITLVADDKIAIQAKFPDRLDSEVTSYYRKWAK